ncbi:MAG: menaquinone biosynthesis protein [Acidobacteriota bacterium]|jgi:chorismate dehydratase|nr:menaquinone biosynthesis protein [Acidobacteriota bacterium]
MAIRISLVHFLNSAPLGWGFLHGPFKEGFEVIPSAPSACADQLARGEADIGLIPSVEVQRIPGLAVIPGIAIASLEKVRSLLLIRPKGTRGNAIRSVALDTSSRTTVALTKILLAETMGLHPEFVPHPPDLRQMLARCDAALLIGDAALQVNLGDYDTIDLVEAWVGWQGKPFVCAVWAYRKSVEPARDLVATFQAARDWGMERFPEICAAYSKSLNLPAAFLEGYLRDNIDFNLGPRHLEGLREFHRLATKHKLIPELRDIEFINGQGGLAETAVRIPDDLNHG